MQKWLFFSAMDQMKEIARESGGMTFCTRFDLRGGVE